MSNKLSFTGERLVPDAQNASVMVEHLHRYAFASLYCKGKMVLDIASGEGYGSHIISKVAKQVTGVDIDESVIAYAQKEYVANNLSFKTGRADKIPMPDASVDVVVSFETIEHHDKHEEMMKEVKRVLRPDGLFIISTPEKKYYTDETGYNNPFHVKELYQHEFEALLKKYFKNLSMVAQQSGMISVLYPTVNTDIKESWLAKGNTQNVEVLTSTQPLYLVALASDQQVQYHSLSFFKDNSIVEDINRRQVEALLNSRTYKAGKLLLAPLTWIRSILKGKA